MINRITEAFNKPYFEITAIDSLIISGVILAIFIPIYCLILKFEDK